MLLLIPRHFLECPHIPEADADDILDNLFDIRLGLIEDRYLHLTNDARQPVYFITGKAFTNIPDFKGKMTFVYNEWEQLNDLDPDWIKSIEDGTMQIKNQEKDLDETGKLSERKGYIKEKRLLRQSDFLISIRGLPRGFSLLKFDQLKKHHIVPSHYFVKLSPRYPGEFNLEYLHIILDQFTKHELVNSFLELQKKTKEIGKSYALFNSFSIENLKKQKIKYHSKLTEQDEIAQMYRKQYEKCHLQNLIFNQFEESIYETIRN
jgi:hypothetical protein